MLTVMTLNIWNYEGPWAERLPLIREWIRLLDPDLIGLQEVLYSETYEQAAEIFEGFDYHREYAGEMEYWNDRTLKFGNLIASRWPITEVEITRLPMAGKPDQRALLAATIGSPHGNISFATTHLSSGQHEGYIREQQVKATGDALLKRRTRNDMPTIFCGDFNATPDTSEIRYIKGLHSIEGRSLYFQDAWEQSGDGSAGYTFTPRNNYRVDSNLQPKRLDYIFVEHLEGQKGTLKRCDVVCHVPRHGVYPSDHFGLFAEIETG
jgi:endonuclease/exonuclease/phosphatase family metal-dependent hydrolase